MIEEIVCELKANRSMLFGAIIICLLLFIVAFAPTIAPHDPLDQDLQKRLSPPSSQYPLGTDNLGRCILSRLVYGSRASLPFGLAVSGAALIIGALVGAFSGYLGGRADVVAMRIVDVLLAFPGLVLALAFVAILGPGLINASIALVAAGWAGYARMVRASTLAIKDREFVDGVRTLGASDFYIIARHIVPNVVAPVLPMAFLGAGYSILALAGLSFLGLGVRPPAPEWGLMLSDGRIFMRSAPHLMIFPGLALSITILAFNSFGDGLRDALQPKSREMIHITK
ncbi:MAG TPA: ABC transporter permease [Methanotrichaceae archaeon]|nr:ABC transporter permease [Methanotrichaceae archaeon]HQF15742.1 ABC transporter permease [Methanotrichaceae archaeon]HQI90585.1 ABC transporter permease [Methanotrichaceae archaeon]